MMNPLKIAASLLLAGASAAAVADTYDPATNQLTIPSVLVGGMTYNDIVITVGQIVSLGGGAAASGVDSYDPASNQLTIASVQVGGTTYTNVVITVDSIVSISGGAKTGTTACDSGTAPAGISYSQTGNTITVTTNGRCVPLPTAGLCMPSVPQATGVNLMMTTAVRHFALSGISFNIPGMSASIFEGVAQGLVNTSTCIQNAPSELSSLTVEADVCYDVTQEMGPALQPAAGMITVTPPVAISLQSTTAISALADCMTSGADVIYDSLTGKAMVKLPTGGYSQPN